MNRDNRFTILFTDEERLKVEKRAKNFNMDLSKYIRRKLIASEDLLEQIDILKELEKTKDSMRELIHDFILEPESIQLLKAMSEKYNCSPIRAMNTVLKMFSERCKMADTQKRFAQLVIKDDVNVAL